MSVRQTSRNSSAGSPAKSQSRCHSRLHPHLEAQREEGLLPSSLRLWQNSFLYGHGIQASLLLQSQHQAESNPGKAGATLLWNRVPPTTLPVFHQLKASHSCWAYSGKRITQRPEGQRWHRRGCLKICSPKWDVISTVKRLVDKKDTAVALNYVCTLFYILFFECIPLNLDWK